MSAPWIAAGLLALALGASPDAGRPDTSRAPRPPQRDPFEQHLVVEEPRASAVTTSHDEWFTKGAATPERSVPRSPISRGQFLEVDAPALAEEMLKAGPVVELADEEAEQLVGRKVTSSAVWDQIVREAEREAKQLVGEEAASARRRGEQARKSRGIALRPFLVRAMSLSGGTLNVWSYQDGTLEVRSCAMGASAAPAHRSPMVVWLERPPARLVVTASMTE